MCMHVYTCIIPLGPNLPGGSSSKMFRGDLIMLLINNRGVIVLDKSFSERSLTDVSKSSLPPLESAASPFFIPIITSIQ